MKDTRFKKGMTPWNKGKKAPQISASRMGSKNPMYGKTLSPEHRRKLSEAMKGRRPANFELAQRLSWEAHKKMVGEKHPNWIKDRTDYLEKKRLRSSWQIVAWRNMVFERDKFTCQDCGVVGVYLEAHHIKSFAKHPKLRLSVLNGLTLCKPCHKLTENYAGKNA